MSCRPPRQSVSPSDARPARASGASTSRSRSSEDADRVSSDAADESISDDSPLFGRPRVVCHNELVEAAEVNERAAAVSTYWAALYGEYAAGLAGFLTKVVGDREVAAELVQETFVRAIRAEPVDQRFVRRWLYRIASNLARDHHRHRRLLRFVPFSGIERGPSGIPDPEIDLIHRALQALPAAQATTLLLHYDAGFSRSEIAAMEGITEEAVKSRLARGRERFIREFERLGRVDGR